LGGGILIYLLNDIANDQQICFVPDANIQAEGQALNIPNTIWNIGTIDDANALLPSLQQSFLELYKDNFSVCSTTIDADQKQTWQACDLTKEQPNTDKIYQIFNVLNGLHTEVVGLDNAYNQVELTKQAFLEWSGINNISTLEELPKLPKKRTQTEGTQTL
jgi:hypothetical protein